MPADSESQHDPESTADFIGPAKARGTSKSSLDGDTVDFTFSGEQILGSRGTDDADVELTDLPEGNYEAEISGPALPRFGRYVLLEQLGRGGMGEVYRALHTRLHKQVALKLLPTGRATNRQARERFEREIQLISRLTHPNVVRLENAGEIEGQPYIVMEYVAGWNLKQLVTLHGPLRVADACQLVGQAAMGLEHMHFHRLLHRDIKPSNLLFSKIDGSLKIADLGVARLAEGTSEITGSGKVVGDPHYMSPEQIEGKTLDIRCDIYSLGCTLFTLLTGKPPFNEVAGDIPEVLKGHLHRAFPRLASRCPEASVGLQRVLDQMTARDATNRLARPVDVASALKPFAAGCDLKKLVQSVDPEVDGLDSGSMSGIHSAEYLSQKPPGVFEKPRKKFNFAPWGLALVIATVAIAGALYWFGFI